MRRRCPWAKAEVGAKAELETAYHDREWGVPQHDDRLLFELLILEGAQAGLSWSTILRKRTGYRKAFDNFNPNRIARYDSRKIQRLLRDPGIVRNKLKIAATVQNAKAFLRVQEQWRTFDAYIWRFVGGSPIQNAWRSIASVPDRTPESDRMSDDLLTRGFKFVGPTICYAFMQAVGMVNDHLTYCFRYGQLKTRAKT
jgi:DNA-3-methyladenine glycosylase I